MTHRIHLARTGTFRDALDREAVIDAALLADMAAGYNTAMHKAPLVLGHPADGAPAYGWVEKLEVGENGDLYGHVDQVAPDLADAVAQGKYRHVSISFWPKGHANSPDKSRASLRHVGILGAQSPVVKGLAPLAFADDADVVTIEFADTSFGWRIVKDFMRGMREYVIGRDGQETADRIVPAYLIDGADEAADRAAEDAPQRFADAVPKTTASTPVEPPVSDPAKDTKTMTTKDDQKATELAEREAALADREAAVKAAEDAAAAAAATARDTAALAFADGLIAQGKLAPTGKEIVVRVHGLLAGSDEPISFADGTSKPALAEFEALLNGGKAVINLGEVSKGDGSTTEVTNTAAAIEKRAATIRKDDPSISLAESIRIAEKDVSA